MEYSHYQEKFYDNAENGVGHTLLEAKAGSGKTTTIVEAANRIDPSWKTSFVAFNKSIATELSTRLPSNVRSSTLNSMGYRNILYADNAVKVEPNKNRYIYRKFGFRADLETPTVNLVSFAKTTDQEYPDFRFLMKHFDMYIEDEEDEQLVIEQAGVVLAESNRDRKMIDLDDQVYMPALGYFRLYKNDALFVDEGQDLNSAQIAMIIRSIKQSGRIFVVGDRNQSIYAFRGADLEAMDRIKRELSAYELPLSICYRCCKAVVREAQAIVPEIEWAPSAIEGVVKHEREKYLLDRVAIGDNILCRTNAPLMHTALILISRGLKAVVRGRDIGKSLKQLITKVQRTYIADTLTRLLLALREYRVVETPKLVAADKPHMAATLDDQVESILALSSGVQTIDELYIRIETIFSDADEGIVLSSIHRAKGTEANRIFVIHPEFIPHPMARTPWAKQQELNLKYVAITRAKQELVWVH
jgi:DNA helicase-2/ATP-dependent DNA helicase PcrA